MDLLGYFHGMRPVDHDHVVGAGGVMFTELRLVAIMDAKVPSQSAYQVLSRWIVEFPTFDLLYHLSDQSKLGIISTFVLIAIDEVTLVEAQAAG